MIMPSAGRGAYDQEHYALVEAIRNGTPYNEGHYGATSSFTAVLGRSPTPAERGMWEREVSRGGIEAERDLVWTLVNTHEFLFIQ